MRRFHLNGHTIGFPPQTQNVRIIYKTKLIEPFFASTVRKVPLNGHTIRFLPQTQKLELLTK